MVSATEFQARLDEAQDAARLAAGWAKAARAKGETELADILDQCATAWNNLTAAYTKGDEAEAEAWAEVARAMAKFAAYWATAARAKGETELAKVWNQCTTAWDDLAKAYTEGDEAVVEKAQAEVDEAEAKLFAKAEAE